MTLPYRLQFEILEQTAKEGQLRSGQLFLPAAVRLSNQTCSQKIIHM